MCGRSCDLKLTPDAVGTTGQRLFTYRGAMLWIAGAASVSSFYYYIDKSIARHFSPTVCINNREKAGNDVNNILTNEDMEKIRHSGLGCQ